MNQMRKRV